jgi:hypothetical protein
MEADSGTIGGTDESFGKVLKHRALSPGRWNATLMDQFNFPFLAFFNLFGRTSFHPLLFGSVRISLAMPRPIRF